MVVYPSKVIPMEPASVPLVAEVVIVMDLSTWPGVEGSSPFGHIRFALHVLHTFYVFLATMK
jgi:hypothetical protein